MRIQRKLAADTTKPPAKKPQREEKFVIEVGSPTRDEDEDTLGEGENTSTLSPEQSSVLSTKNATANDEEGEERVITITVDRVEEKDKKVYS